MRIKLQQRLVWLDKYCRYFKYSKDLTLTTVRLELH